MRSFNATFSASGIFDAALANTSERSRRASSANELSSAKPSCQVCGHVASTDASCASAVGAANSTQSVSFPAPVRPSSDSAFSRSLASTARQPSGGLTVNPAAPATTGSVEIAAAGRSIFKVLTRFARSAPALRSALAPP